MWHLNICKDDFTIYPFLQIQCKLLFMMGLHSLGPITRIIPPRILLSSVRREYCRRNVVKTLDSRGMIEDVFPKESVHKLGEDILTISHLCWWKLFQYLYWSLPSQVWFMLVLIQPPPVFMLVTSSSSQHCYIFKEQDIRW